MKAVVTMMLAAGWLWAFCAAPAQGQYHDGSGTTEDLDVIAGRQVDVLEGLAHNAVTVYMPEGTRGVPTPGVRRGGEVDPTGKISAHLDKSLTKGFILVDVYPDVDDYRARSAISKARGVIIENEYLAPETYLVSATKEIVTALSKSDEVSRIWPASDAIINGEPVHRCPGGLMSFGIVPNYTSIGEGWDGPGLGSASLTYHFVNGTAHMWGEQLEIEAALNEWPKYADITFTKTYTAGQDQSIDIMWAYGDHGDGYPFDCEGTIWGNILAHAFYPHYQPCDQSCNLEPLAGDMHFDECENWCSGCDCNDVDLFSVALHELGHSLGVGHSEVPLSVMYPYFACWRDYDEPLHQDDIDALRSLYASRCYACNFTITRPTNDSRWECGNYYYIRWDSECNRGNRVGIELYEGDSLIESVVWRTCDIGSYEWRVPEDLTPGNNYRLKITDTSDSACAYGWSSYFEITRPCTFLSSPSANSIWECDNTYAISWDPIPETNLVDIWLSDGSDWWPIAEGIDDTGSESWTVPAGLTPGCNYRIEVRSSSNPYCKGTSETFCIVCPCEITVTVPDGGWWQVGSELPVRWDSAHYSGDVKIELYKGNVLVRIITSGTPDDGFYDWPIPEDGSLTGNDFQIKVTAVADSSCYDYSYNFGIGTPPEAQGGITTANMDTPVTITLRAVDEGHPNPPGALTYIIMSLPLHGQLNDPHSGLVTDPCTALASYGNQVEYIPDIEYGGYDSFTFKANDGGVWPGGGDSNTVGILIKVGIIYFASMDNNPGWSASGDWQWGKPGGGGGLWHGNPDPNSGYTGLNVYGINLDGDYSDGIGGPYYLTTPPINLLAYTNVGLKFYRWLNCDYQPYVNETIEVSNDGNAWTVVWANGGPPDVNDDFWRLVEYDVRSVADNQATFYIRWGHHVASASAYAYSGWNIDDVLVVGKRIDFLLADFDGDERVTFKDFDVLAAQWLQPAGVPSADVAPAIRDDLVDALDLAVFAEEWLAGI